MRVSQYNIFFPHLHYVVGYNALADDFIFLTVELYELFSNTLLEDINRLETLHPDFWNLLVAKSFCIPEQTDELQKVKDLVYSIDRNSEHYHLIINPTLNCNFKCWYCYETHIPGSKMNKDTIEKIKRHIAKKLSNGIIKQFTVSWFGGEPLLYFKQVILPMLEFVHEYTGSRDIQFNSDFTSNGLLIDDNILSACKNLHVTQWQITLDGHRKRHNQVRYIGQGKESYDLIVANIKRCLQAGMKVTCRINLSKETLTEDVTQIIEDFSDLSSSEKQLIDFSFNKVWQESTDLHTEILQIIKFFHDQNFVVNYNKFIDTVRNSCYADKMNQATINYNGDVFKCTARDFIPESKEGILTEKGDIEWNKKYYERMDAKFHNPSCLICKILPICNGGCSQQALEHKGREYCIHNYDENIKLDIIRDKLLYVIN
ncbi:radical SAM/SPASM domain-containing protein [Microbacter margulisiae]|uniref:Radical SAM core domain-containing protein n=1 Tax=Microbacter margulisiae TaxID=1350067 RepID=A0A7W5DT91_9PORP|nr:radical SAM protein [Microbacter margulisiae]MBB3188340.1 uncharacterized protein [Microbacter margulisiae]